MLRLLCAILKQEQANKQEGISTNILAKMGKDEPISLESLAKICTTLNCGLDDIVEITTDTQK
ncbi:helix-turn-helix domain-containing protein [Phascolarctobacterium faecium]|uniref:helix-turn-helix domain-containing protein n=1 Tax=Phascolarctobacterium faecium TaxID=33025 RepID=UPI002A844531|nr:helix-turn-helix transcriptional regulator [Massilioclostridium sp.]